VLAATPSKGTILSSNVDQSKGGIVRNVLASEPHLEPLIVSKAQHELSAIFSVIIDADDIDKRPVVLFLGKRVQNKRARSFLRRRCLVHVVLSCCRGGKLLSPF